MAITITAAPSITVGTRMPVIFSVTSDRDNAVSQTSVSFSDYSGTVAGTVKGTKTAHGLLTGDIVQVTLTSMNGTYAITKIDANNFYFTCTYSATDTSGTVTRLNSSFQVRCDVTNAAGDTIWATKRKDAVAGVYTFDIASVLDKQITPAPRTLGGTGAVANTDGYEAFNVTFTEEYEDQNGLLKEGDSADGNVYDAIRAATQYNEDQDIADYVAAFADTGKFLTTSPDFHIASTEEVQLSLLVTSATESVNLYLLLTNSAGATSSQTVTAVTIVGSGTLLATFPVNSGKFGSNVRADCTAKDQAGNVISETKTIYIDQPCSNGKRVWWRNPLGGYDAYTFPIQPDKNVEVSRSAYAQNNATKGNYTYKVSDVDSWEEVYVSSSYLTPAQGEWLATLLRSKEVYVQDGSTLRPILLYNDSERIGGEDMIRIVLHYRMAEGLK